MQENIEIYEQILQAKIYHKKFISRLGPFGEQRISSINKDDNYYSEYGFEEDDYNEIR